MKKIETFHLNMKHLIKEILILIICLYKIWGLREDDYMWGFLVFKLWVRWFKFCAKKPVQNWHLPLNKLWCSWPDLLLARDTCWGSCLSRSGCWSPCCHERSVLIQETLILTLAVSSATPASPDPATTISDLLTLVS